VRPLYAHAMELHSRIHIAIGLKPTRLQPLHGGCIAQVVRAEFADHPPAVVKSAAEDGTLDVEAFMLGYLARNSRLPVPRVLHAEPSLLIMEHLPGSSRFSPAAEEHAADLLADLHSIRGDSFGFVRDTLIGSLHQPNPPAASWLEFFANHRLLYMAGIALRSGALDASTHERLQRLAADLPRFIDEPAHPSLLHGDVWTTNVLAEGDRISGFLDPAIYWGHPEIELAFTTLFGAFGDAFFRRYHQRRPIPPGFFEQRRDLYNLYPLLVHVALFGGGYAQQVRAILRRLGY
jgi:fructosamine-3-kinase